MHDIIKHNITKYNVEQYNELSGGSPPDSIPTGTFWQGSFQIPCLPVKAWLANTLKA